MTLFTIDAFTSGSTETIPSGTNILRTDCYDPAVPERGSALYVLDPDQSDITATGQALVTAAVTAGATTLAAEAAITDLESYFRFKSDNDFWFTLAEERPSSDMFGAPGDGSFTFTNPAASTGTDVTANLQALFDYCIRYAKRPAYISAGIHLVSDTLHIGYGDTFIQLEVFGAGGRFGGETAFSGSAIVLMDDPELHRLNRPVINIQGGRSIAITGLAIPGYLGKKIYDDNMAYNTTPLVDDTDPAEWDDATFGIADARYKPYCGICIDGYAGTDNSQRYPAPTRPAWVPDGDVAYGKVETSGIQIEDCDINGFTVAVMNNPSNADAQGDFLKIKDSVLHRCKYLVSIGVSQSRNVGIDNCKCALYFCAITNRIHGMQLGHFGGTILDTSLGAGIDLIDIGLSTSNAFTFQNCYCEAQWRIGRVVHASIGDIGLVFKDCNLSLVMAGQMGEAADVRGVPGAVLYNPDYPGEVGVAGVKFEGGHLYVDSVASMMAICHVEGTRLLSVARTGVAISNPYERHLHNALAGGWALLGLNGNDYAHEMAFDLVDLDTGGRPAVPSMTEDGYKYSSRNYGTPVYVRTMRARDDRMFEAIPRGYSAQIIGKTSLTNYSWSGKELTFEYNGATRYFHGDVLGFGPGGVMLDQATGSVLVIRSAVEAGGKLTVIAVLQNNYKDGGGGTPTRIQAISLTATAGAASAWHVVHGRFFTLPMPHNGDFTASSDTITNVEQGDGTTALSSSVVVSPAKTVNGSPVVCLWDAGLSACVPPPSGVVEGAFVTGAGIPGGARVVSVIGNSITLSANATATTLTASLTFGGGTTLPGDSLFLGHLRRPLLVEYGSLIMDVNQGAKTIEVNGTAAFSASRERLSRFIRALPANA